MMNKQLLYIQGINADTEDNDELIIREYDGGLLLEMHYTQINFEYAALKQLRDFLITIIKDD